MCCGPFASTYGGKPGQYSSLCGSYMYSEVQRAGFTTHFDNETQSDIGYLSSTGKDGYSPAGLWMSYLDKDGVTAIVDYAKSKKLAGAFSFDISMDSNNGAFTYDLTSLIYQLEN